ncbi:MAG TPA: tetratricopeptide repeat protein [Thermoanaerobaculia bacterium]|nr:tetratricopeptide repeat protein [Thermoanaerobaculia bacterium]
MRRPLLWLLAVLLMAAALPAAGTRILLVARDREEHLLPRFRFAYGGVESQATNQTGATELELPPDHRPGQQIKIHLVPGSKQAEEWFLVNPQVNIPTGSASAELVLMRRREFRQLAAEARDTPREARVRTGKLTEEGTKRALLDAAAHYGLTAEQLETAIRSFADTQDTKDQAIADYLEGHYSQAEEILKGRREKLKDELVETNRYLGASQYEQAEYAAAIESFREALILRPGDADLLSRLGETLAELAEWTESETLLRRALAIYEKRPSPEDPKLAGVLNNLATLLRLTNRMAESEPLLRRALAIDQKSFGPEHPNVARDLKNLAALLYSTNRMVEAEGLLRWALPVTEKSYGLEHSEVAAVLTDLAALLQTTNRVAEAEPLLRRALAIDEKSLGPDHPEVATLLSNLAALYTKTNRMAEAEPLLRRALAIDEKSLGPEHPEVARPLNNLAGLYIYTNRMAEAEPLLRRALAIDEKSLGPEHPSVAPDLINLASVLQEMKHLADAEPLLRRALAINQKSYGLDHPDVATNLYSLARLLQAMNRMAEAEPLLRQALASDEKVYGPDHPEVATDLWTLAKLLMDSNRITEAEPLMRRAVVILLGVSLRTGHKHENEDTVSNDYRKLLEKMNKSPAEIEAMIEALAQPSK